MNRETCDEFYKNPTINPLTGRTITYKGIVWKKINEYCESIHPRKSSPRAIRLTSPRKSSPRAIRLTSDKIISTFPRDALIPYNFDHRDEKDSFDLDVDYFIENIIFMDSSTRNKKLYISLGNSFVSENVATKLATPPSKVVVIKGEKSVEKLLKVIRDRNTYSVFIMNEAEKSFLSLKMEWLLLRIILEKTPAMFCIYATTDFSSHDLNSFLRERTQDYTILHFNLTKEHVAVIINIMPVLFK